MICDDLGSSILVLFSYLCNSEIETGLHSRSTKITITMKDFKYYAPTEVVFGKNSENQIGKMAKKYGAKRVMLHYGGQSAERSGLLKKVREQLTAEGIAFVELGGVVPNPRVSLVRKGVEICRKENIDFILAVGGGSVIDSAKAMSVGISGRRMGFLYPQGI